MNVIVDSCFWFSLLQTRDSDHHAEAVYIYEFLTQIDTFFIIPYPSLYETLNTKLLKLGHREQANWFCEKLATDKHFIRVADDKYRESALNETISPRNNRGLSFVDTIIRAMIKDRKQINGLITFNTKDFSDICYQYGIEIIDERFPKSKDHQL